MSHPAYVIKELENGEVEYQRQKHADLIFDGAVEDRDTVGDVIPEIDFEGNRKVKKEKSLESLIQRKNPSRFWLNGTYHLSGYPFSNKIFIPLIYKLDEDILYLYLTVAAAIEEQGEENFEIEKRNLATNRFNERVPYLATEIAESADFDTENILKLLENRFGEIKDFRD